jgi:hypothetical protein
VGPAPGEAASSPAPVGVGGADGAALGRSRRWRSPVPCSFLRFFRFSSASAGGTTGDSGVVAVAGSVGGAVGSGVLVPGVGPPGAVTSPAVAGASAAPRFLRSFFFLPLPGC